MLGRHYWSNIDICSRGSISNACDTRIVIKYFAQELTAYWPICSDWRNLLGFIITRVNMGRVENVHRRPPWAGA